MANNTIIVCTNVFKHEDSVELKKCFTDKWVELINQLEKTKNTTSIS